MANTSIRYLNYDGLLNAGVSDFLLQDNELSTCKNAWSYKIGKLQKVPGYSLVGDQIVNDKSVSYLHYYYDVANSTNYLLAVSDSSTNLTLKYRTTGNWSIITGISTTWNTYATSLVSMVNYLGKAFIVGHKTGSTFLPNATVDGTTFSASDSDITDMPQAKYICRYRDLLYVGYAKTGSVVYPSRVYYCDEPTAGAIGWTGTATNFIEFGYDDGDEITGMAEASDRLIVFKRDSMWKYDEFNRAKIANIGCDSYRSIQVIDGVLYWTNRKGVYRWTGGYPELISAKAQEFFDGITQTTLSNQVACRYNETEYRVFIGNITISGYDYVNAWFCWDTMREKCYIRCTYDTAKSACEYIESSVRRSYFGNDDGYVMKFATPVDKIYADNSQEIDSFFITKAYDYGVPEDVKLISDITVFTNYAAGMKCAVQVDNDNAFREVNSPIFKKHVEHITLPASGNRLRFKFYEKNKGKSWEFEGMVVQTQIKEKPV